MRSIYVCRPRFAVDTGLEEDARTQFRSLMEQLPRTSKRSGGIRMPLDYSPASWEVSDRCYAKNSQ
jgi:hypothetical protein